MDLKPALLHIILLLFFAATTPVKSQKLYINEVMQSNPTIINTEPLPPDIYFIQIDGETHKIIKK